MTFFRGTHNVSNPWREAIEGAYNWKQKFAHLVSNPWREAIEVKEAITFSQAGRKFPILGGRLLKIHCEKGPTEVK